MTRLPEDINPSIENAFQRARLVPGFLADNELRFLGALAACTPAQGAIVEIGNFKGKSTVMLSAINAKYGQGRVVAIDPHAGLGYLGPHAPQQDPTFEEFLASLKSAGVEQNVEVRPPSPAMSLKTGIVPSACSGSMAIIPTVAARRISICSRPF